MTPAEYRREYERLRTAGGRPVLHQACTGTGWVVIEGAISAPERCTCSGGVVHESAIGWAYQAVQQLAQEHRPAALQFVQGETIRQRRAADEARSASEQRQRDAAQAALHDITYPDCPVRVRSSIVGRRSARAGR